ncbi:2-alkenal reductase OS=Lysinibacillus sphaericus OX=1421 GN=LS41612_00505 PE=3 SV=1 [Lysinibacillus sphaericus]
MSYLNDNDKNSDFLNNDEIQKSPLQERLEREEKEMQAKRSKKKDGGGGKGGYFFSGLIGVIIGALLVWLMLPGLVNQMPGTTTSSSGKNEPTINQVATEVTTDVTGAVEKASGAVVGITNIQEVASGGFWNQQTTQDKETGSGSGVIYKVEGDTAFIVTNNHVIEGAKQLEVTCKTFIKASII